MRPSGSDTRLNVASAGIIASRRSQDVRVQLIFLYTIYSISSIFNIITDQWLKSESRKYLEKNIRDWLWRKP